MEQGRHRVDHQGVLGDIAPGEVDEEPSGEHKDRVARRVAHFELGTLRDEFGAVPEAGGRFDGQQICSGGHYEAEPAQHIVVKSVFFHKCILGFVRVQEISLQSAGSSATTCNSGRIEISCKINKSAPTAQKFHLN